MFFLSCSSESIDSAKAIDISYDNEISKPRISVYQEEYKVIYAVSDMLYKNEEENAILVGNVISKFFNESGSHISTLKSDSAMIENFSNNLTAIGNVVVVSDSGYTLHSNSIYWNNQYKLVTSNDSVIFTNSYQDTMYGVGFESDIDLTRSKIFKPYGIVGERKK
jgi:lipopolysaccharide assembly outer membrane protein LptD (OstA)